MAEFVQFVVTGLTTGSFYALIALGYTMFFGIVRLINFSHGDVVMVGAFLGWTVLTALSLTHVPWAFALIIALIFAMTLSGGLGVFIERFAFQPLLSAPRLSIFIVAVAVSLALENGVLMIFGPGFQAYPHLISTAGFTLGGAQISDIQLGIIAISFLLMGALYLFVKYTFIGTAMRALAVDRDAARLMGINVERVIQVTFFIGSALAATAGVMEVVYYSQINFFMGFVIGLRAFTAAVLGGIGNIPGAMAGGLIIGLLESFSDGYISSSWTDVIVFLVLIAILVIKPTGLFGAHVVERM